MASINKVILLGRLGGDPELKHTGAGVAYCRFSVATSKKYKDKSGEQKEKTTWHRIVAWNKTAELANQYLRKGNQVYLEGEIEIGKWKDKDGNERDSIEINAHNVTFLEPKPTSGYNHDSPENQRIDEQDINNSDIPF